MSQEPITARTLDDLSEIEIYITITRPDGQKVDVPLRAMTGEEVWKIRRTITWPKPPIKDFQKIRGKVEPIYDEQNADYQAALEDANRLLSYRMMLGSLKIEIPGATEEERLANLMNRLGQWAFNHLLAATSRLNIPQLDEVVEAALSFRPLRFAEAQGNGVASTDAARLDESEAG
jgi:hypothetical protein